MPQEIYNKGRVIGLSAWELFARKAAERDVVNIPDENKWLASMIGIGASMVLKVPQGTQAGICDFPLPAGSNLGAAGVVFANPLGDCQFDSDSGWAKKVTSYSPLVKNTSGTGNNPPASDGTIPSGTYNPEDYAAMLSDFVKITDGVIYLKDATWINTGNADEIFTGDGTTTNFVFSTPADKIATVKLDGITVATGWSFDIANNQIKFTNAPANDVTITVNIHLAPHKDIYPNYSSSTTIVRLYLNADLNNDVYILFTGFTDKALLQTYSGYADPQESIATMGSTDTEHNDWVNGGMLGPEVTPWSSKIVFSVPTTLYNTVNALTRTIPSDTSYTAKTVGGITFKDVTTTIRTNTLIDFNSINLTDYYNIHSYSTSPTLQESVANAPMGLGDSYNTVVAWYPGMTASKISAATDASKIFPPALYAAQVTDTGTQTLVPLDVAAPGTVKGFENSTEAYNYTQRMPNNYAVYHNTTYNTYSFVIPNDSNPDHWAGTAKLEYLTAPKVQLTVGSQVTKLVSLTNSSGTDYGTNGNSGSVSVGPSNDLVWDNLLTALKDNKKIDVLGTKLHNLGTELTSQNTIGYSDPLAGIGTKNVTIYSNNSTLVNSSLTVTTANGSNLVTANSGSSFKSGTNFIEFSNGLRLYISATNPGTSNVPVGSIGIGWVNS